MKRVKYQAPVAQDISGLSVSGLDPLGCGTGPSPQGGGGGDDCYFGIGAGGACREGASPVSECAAGYGVAGSGDCISGTDPSGSACGAGGTRVGAVCSAGSAFSNL